MKRTFDLKSLCLDYVLTTDAPCPYHDQLKAQLEQSKEIMDIIADNKELFEYLSVQSGNNITKIINLEYLYDALFIEV